MASKVEICNQALSILGVAKEIANIETERSAEASACRRFYPTTLDEVLRDFAWPFATKIAAMGLVEADPTTEWAFSYRYPSDCLMFKRAVGVDRTDTPDTRVPVKIISDDAGLLILCDLADMEGEYTFRADDPLRYPPDFVSALALLLATKIAPRVTAGDPFGLGMKALNLYAFAISKARANAANEEQRDYPSDAEIIRARE